MIYFFTKGGNDVPSSRQRVLRLSEYLKNNGYESSIHIPIHYPWWNLSGGRWRQIIFYFKIFSAIRRDDVIFLHRTIYSVDLIFIALFFRLIFQKKYIFDFDDAIFIHSPVKTYLLTKLAEKVIVSTHFLYDYAIKINKSAQIITTLIDIKENQKFKIFDSTDNTTNIGWIGAAEIHLDNLKIIAPVLKKLIEKNIKFKFTLVGATGSQKIYQLFNIPNLNIKIIDWLKPEEVEQEILNFDIALSPLEDTPWSRGKCTLKNHEYMQYGIPLISSAVGEANYLIKNYENGILVKNETNEWAEAIINLINDPALRKKIGTNAVKTIRDNFTFESNIKKYLNLFNSL